MTSATRAQVDPMIRLWIGFIGVVIAANIVFGPAAAILGLPIAGVGFIVAGIRSHGWPRPAFIVAGALLILVPALMLADMTLGPRLVIVGYGP